MTFVAGQILTAAQLNAAFGLGKTKKVTATGNVTSADLPTGQSVIVIGWSGGGGSGGCATTGASQCAASAGGGSSPLGITVIPYASIVFPFVVTVGAGGAAGAIGANTGGTGGTTTVIDNNGAGTTYLSLAGGVGGQGSAVQGSAATLTAGGGAPGAATTATFSSAGSVGGSGASIAVGIGRAGAGAAAPMGGGSTETSMANASRVAIAGSVPGGGAAGGAIPASTTQITGAAGGRGEVWFIVI